LFPPSSVEADPDLAVGGDLAVAGFEQIETHRLAEWIEDESDPMIAVTGRAPQAAPVSA